MSDVWNGVFHQSFPMPTRGPYPLLPTISAAEGLTLRRLDRQSRSPGSYGGWGGSETLRPASSAGDAGGAGCN